MRNCCECQKGEHPNYDEEVRLLMVREPDTGRLVVRGYICKEHAEAFAQDGYTVEGAG